MESRRNGPQLSSRHDDDDDDMFRLVFRYIIYSLTKFVLCRPKYWIGCYTVVNTDMHILLYNCVAVLFLIICHD